MPAYMPTKTPTKTEHDRGSPVGVGGGEHSPQRGDGPVDFHAVSVGTDCSLYAWGGSRHRQGSSNRPRRVWSVVSRCSRCRSWSGVWCVVQGPREVGGSPGSAFLWSGASVRWAGAGMFGARRSPARDVAAVQGSVGRSGRGRCEADAGSGVCSVGCCVVDLGGVCRVSTSTGTSTGTSWGASRRMSTRTSRRTPGWGGLRYAVALGVAHAVAVGVALGVALTCGDAAVVQLHCARSPGPHWHGRGPSRALTSPLQPFSDNHGGVGGGCAVSGIGAGLRRRGGARRRGLRAAGGWAGPVRGDASRRVSVSARLSAWPGRQRSHQRCQHRSHQRSHHRSYRPAGTSACVAAWCEVSGRSPMVR